MGIEADRKWKQNPGRREADPNLQRASNVIMSELSNAAQSIPFTGNALIEAADAQRQEKIDKWHELQNGFNAIATGAEAMAAGYGIARGLTHLGRMFARQATKSTGRTISREAMKNLIKWNKRVATIDKPQVLMNGIGGTADAYQWATATNPFDTWENGIETGADAAGVVGGMNWFRDLPYLRKIGGKKIDTVLDALSYGAATWDIVKNLPPLSNALDNIRHQATTKEQKAKGGFLQLRNTGYKHENTSNLFLTGGEKEVTAFTPIAKPVIPKVDGDQEAVNWIANWYNNRREQMYNNLKDYGSTFWYDMKDRLTGIPVGRRAINHDFYDKLNNMAQYKTATFEDLERDNTASYDELVGNAFGIVVPETGKIYYDNNQIQKAAKIQNKQEGYSPLGIRIHERTHTSGATDEKGEFTGYNVQTKALEDILRLKEGIKYDRYTDAMPEIYGRMMEFRYNHNMNPNKKYSRKEVQKMLNQENKGFKSDLQRYDLDSLTKAFNEVAQMDTSHSSNVFS